MRSISERKISPRPAGDPWQAPSGNGRGGAGGASHGRAAMIPLMNDLLSAPAPAHEAPEALAERLARWIPRGGRVLAAARPGPAGLSGELPEQIRLACRIQGARLGTLSPEDPESLLAQESAADLVIDAGAADGLGPDALHRLMRRLAAAAGGSDGSNGLDGSSGSGVVALLASAGPNDPPPEAFAALMERLDFTPAAALGLAADAGGRRLLVFVRSPGRERARMNIRGLLESESYTATYKLALLRALADINCSAPGRARCLTAREMEQAARRLRVPAGVHLPHQAAIPLGLVVERVMAYYWAILRREVARDLLPAAERAAADDLLTPAQIHCGRRLAFETELRQVMRRFRADWHAFRRDFYAKGVEDPAARAAFIGLAAKVAQTLKKGPIHYSGASLDDTVPDLPHHRLFSTLRARGPRPDASAPFTPAMLEAACGELLLPSELWRELNACAPMLVDTVVMRWAECSSNFMAGRMDPGAVLTAMRMPPDERDTAAARSVCLAAPELASVWTGRPLNERTLDVDHMIPWSRTHSNDLWNLVPSHLSENRAKSDLIPAEACLENSRERIIHVWRRFEGSSFGALFRAQAESALIGRALPRQGWETPLFDALERTAEDTARQFACRRWSPQSLAR